MCKVCDRSKSVKPKEGDLRVWHIPQIPDSHPFYVPVKTIEEAKLLLDALGDYDWYLWKHNHRVDYSNASGLEVFEDGDWMEWEDEDGNDIDDHFDEDDPK